MDLERYTKSLEANHSVKIQSGFERNDRAIFIQEILGQLGYTYDNIYDDVPQSSKGSGSKSPDIRLYGNEERKTKHLMSRFVIETKNFNSLNRSIHNIDFCQLKKYVLLNSGKIKYIASTDYVSFFLFRADVLINWKILDSENPDTISNHEIEEFKKVLIQKFDFFDFTAPESLKFEMLSHANLFETYDFPDPREHSERFDIRNKAVRVNFIKSLFYVMESIKNDVTIKFEPIRAAFTTSLQDLDEDEFNQLFREMIAQDEYQPIRNLLLWAMEMNYIDDIFTHPEPVSKELLLKIICQKNPESENYYHDEYLVTAIYSIINKTFFIRILEDISKEGGYRFIVGEANGRYLSNGIIQEKYLAGRLKEYLSSIFEFRNGDLKPYKFLLKHDIYDWILHEVEERTLAQLLITFNEVYFEALDEDILGEVYEHYLEEDRDEDTGKSYRRMLGQYYTPRPIVRLMWLLVRDVLKRRDGRDLYVKDANLLKIVDPFMGSGTFLNEAILQMKMSDSAKGVVRGEVFHFFKDRGEQRRIENSINGFEINPLSCSIADINLYFRLIRSFDKIALERTPIQELNLFRTDSFSLSKGAACSQDPLQMVLFASDVRGSIGENSRINNAKSGKYNIIVSNPPYGEITPNTTLQEEFIPFAYAKNNFDPSGSIIPFDWDKGRPIGRVPNDEKNRGKIKDMFGFAFGVADRLLCPNGIVCFIVSNTLLSVPSYKWLRKYLLDNYSIEYLINFNKTAERSNSMFEPEAAIATCIIVLRKGSPEEGHRVRYRDLSGVSTLKDKYEVFADIEWKGAASNKNGILTYRNRNIDEIQFMEVSQSEFINNHDYIFSLQSSPITTIEADSESLEKILTLGSGVRSGQDDIFVDSDVSTLSTRIQTFLSTKDLSNINKMLKGPLSKLERFPEYSKANIIDFVKEDNIKQYYLNGSYKIYYEPAIMARPGPKEIQMIANKLIVFDQKSTYTISAVVTSEVIIPKGNNQVRFYYTLKENKEDLYYCCAILNSPLMKYFYAKRMGNRYFPIRKINDTNREIYDYIVAKSKQVHEIKADCQKLLVGDTNFVSDYFNTEILGGLEVYPLDSQNNYFELDFPSQLGADFTIDSPHLNPNDTREIILNSQGLVLKFKDEVIAENVLARHLKDLSGNLNEQDVMINITFLDEEQVATFKHRVDAITASLESEVNLLIYGLYLNIPIQIVNQKIVNPESILSNNLVQEIEQELSALT